MRAPRLMPLNDLERIRQEALLKGAIVFRRMCPRQACHSAVVRHQRTVVCLTCGWHKPVAQWGAGHRYVSPSEMAHALPSDFRNLASNVDPGRWSRLMRRARHRGDLQRAAQLQQVEELAKPTIDPAISDKQQHAPRTVDGIELRATPAQRLGSTASQVLIYTDGGCCRNPGPGGWAAILWSDYWELEIAGREAHSTSSRMELRAALEALRMLLQPSRVTIVTDSAYLSSGMTSWITGWSKRDWRRNGKLIPNSDLWQSLVHESLQHETYWMWLKGHAGHTENERCDRLASRMSMLPEEATEEEASHSRYRPRRGRLPRMRGKAAASVWLPSP